LTSSLLLVDASVAAGTYRSYSYKAVVDEDMGVPLA
jgi:hypothetical protein